MIGVVQIACLILACTSAAQATDKEAPTLARLLYIISSIAFFMISVGLQGVR